MTETGIVETLGPIVVLLGSAVVAVPLFRKIGLGSVLGCFAGVATDLAGGDKLHVAPRPEPLIPPRNRPAEIEA